MEQGLVRLLRADEIECRVSVVNEKGLSLLLYKDARVDQRILDETFGAFGWKRSHQCIDGNLYCTVEILNKETDEWIAKQDVGTMGYTEREKSQASDSFKRACFNWGIGRELYSAPFIWIPAGKTVIQMKEDNDKKKRYYCNDRFSVDSIAYNDSREVSALVVINDKGQIVYQMKATDKNSKENTGTENSRNQQKKESQKKTVQENTLTREQMFNLQTELNRTGVAMETVKERYQIQNPESMSSETYQKVMAALAKTKPSKAA